MLLRYFKNCVNDVFFLIKNRIQTRVLGTTNSLGTTNCLVTTNSLVTTKSLVTTNFIVRGSLGQVPYGF
jgi:hypothetical protein